MSSGDVGHFDAAGRLFIDGRDDDMIVSGGENVFPARGRGPARRPRGRRARSPSSASRTRTWGQRLKAVVVLQEGESVDEDELKDYVKQNLAAFKVPREIVFVDALPRNATGKVLKRQLV